MLSRVFPRKIKVPVTLVGESGVKTVSVRYVDEPFLVSHPNVIDLSDPSRPAIINYRPYVPTLEGKCHRTYDPFSLLFTACATPVTHTVRQIMARWNLPYRQASYVWKAAKEFRSLPGFAREYLSLLSKHAEIPTSRESFDSDAWDRMQVR